MSATLITDILVVVVGGTTLVAIAADAAALIGWVCGRWR